jgi:hypothetical protein
MGTRNTHSTPSTHIGEHIMPRKQGTSKKDASIAAKLLSDPKTPPKIKSVAASDLAQTRPSKPKGKSK